MHEVFVPPSKGTRGVLRALRLRTGLLVSLALTAPGLALAASPAAAPSPQASSAATAPVEGGAPGGTTLATTLNSAVDAALLQFVHADRVQLFEGRRPTEQRWIDGPAGRTALVWPMDHPEGTRWQIHVYSSVRPATAGPVAPGSGPGLELLATYDVLRAHQITASQWSSDGEYLAVLSQTESLTRPGGELVVMMPGRAMAKRIDTAVFRFAMSPDGQHLVYEKARSAQDLLGAHDVVHMDGATGQPRVIHPLAYPTWQVERLGPFQAGSPKVEAALADYSGGLARQRIVTGHLDLAQGKFVTP